MRIGTIRASFQIFVKDYIQGKGNVLFAVNKEEIRKPIGIRSDIVVKISNEELNYERREERTRDSE